MFLPAPPRLLLRRPTQADLPAIFQRYATDPAVTRYLSWPTHRTLEDTRAFLAFSDQAWAQWQTGPLLALERSTGRLLGSTGLDMETPTRASTGYLLARDAWGQGYASEILAAMVDLAVFRGLRRLQAQCHAEHLASARVLEKGGFQLEGTLRRYLVFPNLGDPEPADTRVYARTWDPA